MVKQRVQQWLTWPYLVLFLVGMIYAMHPRMAMTQWSLLNISAAQVLWIGLMSYPVAILVWFVVNALHRLRTMTTTLIKPSRRLLIVGLLVWGLFLIIGVHNDRVNKTQPMQVVETTINHALRSSKRQQLRNWSDGSTPTYRLLADSQSVNLVAVTYQTDREAQYTGTLFVGYKAYNVKVIVHQTRHFWRTTTQIRQLRVVGKARYNDPYSTAWNKKVDEDAVLLTGSLANWAG